MISKNSLLWLFRENYFPNNSCVNIKTSSHISCFLIRYAFAFILIFIKSIWFRQSMLNKLLTNVPTAYDLLPGNDSNTKNFFDDGDDFYLDLKMLWECSESFFSFDLHGFLIDAKNQASIPCISFGFFYFENPYSF